MSELGQTAMENFDRKRLVSSILLTRAAVETAAAQWYLTDKVVAAINANLLGDLDDYLMKLAMGHKSSGTIQDFPVAVNVQISEDEQMMQQTRLLDHLYPSPPVPAKMPLPERVDYKVEWHSRQW
jgi:hypothetical protein